MARPPNFPLPLGHFPGGMFPSPGPFPPGLMFPAVPGPAMIPGMGNFVPRHGFRPPFLQPASFGPGALPPRGPPPRHAGPMVPGQGRGTPTGPRPRGPWAQERRQGNFAQGNRQQRKEPERRTAWLRALKRSEFQKGRKTSPAAWTPKGHERVCSDHFISGHYSTDPADPDYVPSLFNLPAAASRSTTSNPSARKERYFRAAKRLRLSEEPDNSDHDPLQTHAENGTPLNHVEGSTSSEVPLLEQSGETVNTLKEQLSVAREEKRQLEVLCNSLQSEVNSLRKERDELKEQLEKTKVSAAGLTDRKCSLYTGIPTVALFYFVFRLVSDFVSPLMSICPQDQILVTLMKLRLGLRNADLAYRFGISATTVSKVINRCIPILSSRLSFLICWPSRETVKRNLPKLFRKKFANCRVIIDCSEIFTERPYNLETRAKTWSNYKHHHTFKVLIGITPYGTISFLSKCWGGRISDKEITRRSKFYDKIEPLDLVMADRGFTISEELAVKEATLVMPPFVAGRKQLPGKIVSDARRISALRIHVERAIERLKNFQVLSQTLPIALAPMASDIVVICGALTNFLPKLIKK